MTSYRDLLIDDQGRHWQPGSAQLRRRLDIRAPDVESDEYAVRNLGFARIRRRHRSLGITLRSSHLGQRTFEALCGLLAEAEYERIVLEQPGECVGLEMFTRAEDALARIAYRRSSSDTAAEAAFVVDEMALARLHHHKRTELRDQLRRWKSVRGEVPAEWAGGHKMPGRSVITEHDPSTGRALIRHFGTGFTAFDACWPLLAIGRDIEEQPDPLYGERIAQGYHGVGRTLAPVLQLIDATLAVPGRAARRSRYERLLLPWRCCGTVLISSISVLRSSIVIEDQG